MTIMTRRQVPVTRVSELVATTRQAVEDAVELIHSAYLDFPWEDARVYAGWLAQTHHYVRHATRLLARAASRCDLADDALHRNLLRGIREEADHDTLLAGDLAHLGFELADFPELPETAAYHQTLYYAIEHDGPAALLAWFLPLEGLAGHKFGPSVDRVTIAHGRQAATFLELHCKLDVEHFRGGLDAIARLPQGQLVVVARHLGFSSQIYARLIERLKLSGHVVRDPMRRSA
jgi:hypothetical protein